MAENFWEKDAIVSGAANDGGEDWWSKDAIVTDPAAPRPAPRPELAPVGGGFRGTPMYSAENPPPDDSIAETKVINGKTWHRHRYTGEIFSDDVPRTDDPEILKAFGKTKPTKIAQSRINADARLAAQESPNRQGFVERWITNPIARGKNQSLDPALDVAQFLFGATTPEEFARGVVSNLREAAKYPRDPVDEQSMKELQQANEEGWIATGKAIWDNPNLIPQVAAESLPAMAATGLGTLGGGLAGAGAGSVVPVIGTAAGAVTGSIAGTGLASAYSNFSIALVDALTDTGQPVTEQTVLAAISNPEIMARAKDYALKRGVAIGVFDAISAGVAGRIAGPASRLAREGSRTGRMIGAGGEVITQGALGAGGEQAAQTLTGESKPGDVLLEGLAEGVTAPVEIGQAILGRELPQQIMGDGQQPVDPARQRAKPWLFDPPAAAAPQPQQPAPGKTSPPPGAVPPSASAAAPPAGRAPWAPGAGPVQQPVTTPRRPEVNLPNVPGWPTQEQPQQAATQDQPWTADPIATDPTGDGTRTSPVRQAQTEADLESARAQVNVEPSPAQVAAGNYKKGHVKLHGFDIAIENPKGSVRKSKDPANPWESPPMPGDYGYIKGATAKDGDKLDVLIGPSPVSQKVYVIDQNDLNTGKYDEAKVIIGAKTPDQAVSLYAGGFSDGKGADRIGGVTELTVEEFRQWVKSGDTRKPIGKNYRPSAPKAGAASKAPPRLRPATPQEVAQLDQVPSQPIEAPAPQPEAPAPVPMPDRQFNEAMDRATDARFQELVDGVREYSPRHIGTAVRFGLEYRHINPQNARSVLQAVDDETPTANELESLIRGGKVTNTQQGKSFIFGEMNQPNRDMLKAWATLHAIERKWLIPRGDFYAPSREGLEIIGKARPEPTPPAPEQPPAKPKLGKKPKADKPAEAPAPAPEPQKPAAPAAPASPASDYGSNNKLISKDRAAEVREKLKAKLKNQVSSGFDPEIMAMGAELAAFHIEAGARKFADFAKAIASDLGTDVTGIRKYLRAWYNSARDLMEDAGLDVEGMDTPDQVKAALAGLDKEGSDGRTGDRLREEAPGVSAGQPPEIVPEPAGAGATEPALQNDRPAGGGDVREPERADADVERPAERVRRKGKGTRSDTADGGRDRPARDGAAGPRQSDDVAKELRDLEDERAARRARNYRITPEDRIGQGGPKEKVAANIQAIRTLKTILEEKREATPEERKTLVRYVGWGAFAQDVFAKHKPEWAKERAALADLLTSEEFASARASTLNAHYTSEAVIKGMWQALDHLGFKGGRALEPSSGVGHFIGLIPDSVHAATEWSAVELDTITGNIAKLLYSGADVNVTGFEKFNRPPGFYDLAISNVPFGDYRITDPKRPGYLIHDYFFIKGLDLVRPGGLVAFITSSGTMDKQDQTARKEIAKRADFVGAIRLPGGRKGAFAGNAGTKVTTDIIFLRRRGPNMAPIPDAPSWLGLKEITTPDGATSINEYFAANPAMMLGEMRLTGTMYRDKSPVLVGDAENMAQKIAAAAAKMPANIMLERSTAPKAIEKDTAVVEADTKEKEGGYFIKGGKLYRKVQGVGQPQNLGGPDTDKITALVAIRDVVNELLAGQAKGETKNNDALRQKLNKLYDAFVKKHGPINLENTTTTNRLTRSGDFVVITKRPNFSKFSLDPDAFKVAAIENYNPDTKTASKAAIFTADILGPAPAPQIASSADTIGWSLNMHGRLSLPQMASLAGVTEAQLIRDLGDLIYKNPASSEWETRDQYLSGDVVTKLEEAKGAAESDQAFRRNVDALEKVQPAPLTREDIRVPFGAPWVPADVYKAFFRDELDSDITLTLNPVTKRWGIKSARFSRTAETKYATPRMPIDQIVKHALDQTPARVMDKDQDGKLIFNPQESEQAQVRVNALREAFAGSADGAVPGWIWNDDERSLRLEAVYNLRFNRLVPQKFDGSHLTFPGLAATITDSAGQKVPFTLRAHQKNAVARVIQNGNTLFAHVVGAGKTFTMIAAGMEQRRLGQKQRPMFIVPNHMLEQFSREFLQAYPGANILVAQKDEMTRENRKAFAAKIAAQKWDGIIITHDAFGRIRMSQEAYQAFTEAEIEAVIRAKTAAAEEEDKKSPTVKDLEKLEKKLETKLANLIKEERKDEGVTFEELGVDQIYLDEAHLFKNLSFFTRHTRIKGIGGTASQRATDLFMKIRHLEKAYPGRSAVFATGTPVSNTMAEMYTMQRYLQLDTLAEYGVDEFDAWAATFGEVRSQMELGPDGRTLRETTSFSRFINIPELNAMYSRVADAQTADMLNLPRPKRQGGKIEIVEAEFSDREEAAALEIVQRALDLKGKKAEKGADNMLKVVSDGRKLATDARLLNPYMPYNPQGKVAKAIAKIHEIWKAGEYPAIAQVVFLDMGVPQSKKAVAKPAPAEDEDMAEDVDDEAEAALASRFDLYNDIRDRLVSRGIPREQIAFIHEANDDLKKARLFGKVRSGEVRVLLGSTGKMGVGTNVQRLLKALHHLDAPWKPAEVEQRDGRIERQGNLNPEIQIIRYITKKSMDAFMWQTLERKAQFIGQLLAGAKGVRHAEDIDSPLPEAADMKAAATGDPRIMEQAELTKRERELKVAQSSHNRIITEAKRGVGATEARITYLEGQSAAMARDAAKVKPTAGDAFKITLEMRGRQYPLTERKQAGEMLRRFGLDTGRTVWGPARAYDVGTISDLPVQMFLKQSDDGIEYALTVHGEAQYGGPNFQVLTEDADPVGLVRRIENALASVPAMANFTAAELERAKTTLKKLQAAAVKKPFPRQKELDETSARLKQINDEFKKESEPKKPGPQVQGSTGRADTVGDAQQRPTAPPVFVVTKKQVQEANAKAQALARQILGHSVRVEVFDRMPEFVPADFIAAYNPSQRAVYLSMKAAHDMAFNIGHEAIHHLRSVGAITDAEFKVLLAEAKRQNPDGLAESRMDTYRAEYMGRYGVSEQQFRDMIEEEAVADLFGAYVDGRETGSVKANGILQKIRDFIEALFRLMEGMGWDMPASLSERAEKIMGDIYEGGRVEAAAAPVRTRSEIMGGDVQGGTGRDITKTEAFKRWFGKSKVVDAKGEPLVVYHGSAARRSDKGEGIKAFDPARLGQYTGASSAEYGFFFSSSPEVANSYNMRALERSPLGGVAQRVTFAETDLELWETGQNSAEAYYDEDEGGWSVRVTEYDPQFGDPNTYETDDLFDTKREADDAAFDLVKAETEKAAALVEKRSAELEEANRRETLSAGPTVYPVYLSIQNPLTYDFKGGSYEDQSFTELMEEAKEEGHDGVLMKNVRDAHPLGENPSEVSDIWVTFSPTQIKSVFNSGAFDPNNPAILGSTGRRMPASQPGPSAFQEMEDDPIAWWQNQNLPLLQRVAGAVGAMARAPRRAIQNTMADWGRQQDAIEAQTGPIPEQANVYLKETLFAGRAGERLEDLRMDEIEPIINKMVEHGITQKELDDYLYALHAPERNAYIATIDPSKPDGGSGMTNAEANQILRAARASGKIAGLNEVRRMVRSLQQQTRDRLLGSGIIDGVVYQSWTSKYQNYVPLRGFEADPDEDTRMPSGRKYDSRAKVDVRALGRRSRADSPFAYLIAQAQQSIILSEKARVGKAVLEMATQYPNPNLWEVNQVVMKKTISKTTGFVTYVHDNLSRTIADNVLAVRKGGKLYWVTLHHDGLARGMKGMDGGSVNAILRTMLRIQRFLAAVRTGWNPEFFIPNFIRDLGTAGIHVANDQGLKILRQTVRDLPKAFVGSYQGEQGKLTGQWAQYYREFAQAGGKVGAFGLGTIDQIKRKVARDMRLAQGGWAVMPEKGLETAIDFIENWNNAFESTIRLSLYVNMRKAGYSQDESAFAAKEVTVNFNRKGEYGNTINAAYLFFNASIQGTARIAKAVFMSRKVQYAVLGMIATGLVMDALNAAMSGDSDDDGEDDYDQIPEYVKERSLIFMWPGSEKGEYVSIPLPWVYNVFFYAGQNVGRAARGKIDAWEAAGNTIGALAQAANPLYSETWWQMASPTLLDPVLEIEFNKNAFGDPIMPEQEPYQPPVPDSQLKFKSVNPALDAIATKLNEATGGDEMRPGAIDVSPESLEYMVEFVTGGIGGLFNRTMATGSSIVTGEDIPADKIPFVRKVYGKHSDYTGRQEYYEMRDAVALTEAQIKFYKDKGDRETVAKLREKYAADIKAKAIFDATDKALKPLRKRRDAATTVEERNAIIDKIDARMALARKKYRDLLERYPR